MWMLASWKQVGHSGVSFLLPTKGKHEFFVPVGKDTAQIDFSPTLKKHQQIPSNKVKLESDYFL